VEIIHVRFGVMSDGFAMSEIGPLTAEVGRPLEIDANGPIVLPNYFGRPNEQY